MKLSTKSHYGLQAMAKLAQAYDLGPLSLADIAVAEGLSLPYLEQIVLKLRRAGLVEATRGAHGGYHLTAPPTLVTVGEVVRVLEGPIAPVGCASEQEDPNCCSREEECPSRPVWQQLRDSIARVLDATTLADLCQTHNQEPQPVAPPS